MKSGKLLIMLCLISAGIIYSQDTSREARKKILDDVKEKYTNLIKTGISSEDVTLKMGDPNEVHPGIPIHPERLILFPDQKYEKQGLFFTWVYQKDTVKIHMNLTRYYLNGKFVSRDLYNYYSDLKVIYLRKNNIVYPANFRTYGKIGIRIDSAEITSREIKPEESKLNFRTIVYVVFSKRDLTVKSVFVTFFTLKTPKSKLKRG